MRGRICSHTNWRGSKHRECFPNTELNDLDIFRRARFIAVNLISAVQIGRSGHDCPKVYCSGMFRRAEHRRVSHWLLLISIRLYNCRPTRRPCKVSNWNSISMSLVSTLLGNSLRARVCPAFPKIEPSTRQPSFHTFLSSRSPYLALDLFLELSRSTSSCCSSSSSPSSSMANSALGADVAGIALGSNPSRISSPSSSSSYVLLLYIEHSQEKVMMQH